MVHKLIVFSKWWDEMCVLINWINDACIGWKSVNQSIVSDVMHI